MKIDKKRRKSVNEGKEIAEKENDSTSKINGHSAKRSCFKHLALTHAGDCFNFSIQTFHIFISMF